MLVLGLLLVPLWCMFVKELKVLNKLVLNRERVWRFGWGEEVWHGEHRAI